MRSNATSTFRGIATAVTAIATFYFVYWLPGSLVPQHPATAWVPFAGAAACAVAAGRFVWRRAATPPQGIVNGVLLGALLLGGAGFAAGFFGPMILAPGANQGPLLGIFITGPLGVLFGGLGGGAYAWVRGREGRV